MSQTANIMDVLQQAVNNGGQPVAPGFSGGRSQRLVKSFDQLARDFRMEGWDGDAAIRNLEGTIKKALGVNSGTGIAGTQAIHLENLDQTLTEVLFTEKWLNKSGTIPRVPSKNINYEYTRKTSYGSHRASAGFAEGGVPYGSDPTYDRDFATVRFLGERGGVTHQAAVSSSGMQLDPTAEANRDAAIRLMAKIERSLMWGRENILDGARRTVNYDGFYNQMLAQRPANIIDQAGLPLSYNTLEDIGYRFYEEGRLMNFGGIQGFAHPRVVSDLAALKRDSERSVLTTDGKGMLIPGTPFGGYQTQFGYLPLMPDTFMDEVEGGKPVLGAADGNAPAAPGVPTGVAGANTASKMTAGTYTYRVAAFNEQGESLSTASAGVASTTLQEVVLTIPRVNAAVGYRVYRGVAGDTVEANARWIGTVPQPVAGNATFTDVNDIRPNTGMALYYHANPADVAIAQLAPLTKYPLAITSTTIEFLVLLYHTLVIKAPERVVIVKNIGRLV